MDRRSPLQLLALFITALVIYSGYDHFVLSKDPQIGRRFESELELLQFQSGIGYVFLGKFDDKFPAEISSVQTAWDFVEFQLRNGVRHNYKGYDGYGLKVVRLKNAGGESVFVFRTAEKF